MISSHLFYLPNILWHPHSISRLAQQFSRPNLSRPIYNIPAFYFTVLLASRLQHTSQTSQSHQGWVIAGNAQCSKSKLAGRTARFWPALFQVNVSSHPFQIISRHFFYLPNILWYPHLISMVRRFGVLQDATSSSTSVRIVGSECVAPI